MSPHPTTQDYVANLLGLVTVLKGRSKPWPTGLVLRILSDVPISEASVRVTLHRMIGRGMLTTSKVGRNALLSPTEACLVMLRSGRRRIFSRNPFSSTDTGWTTITVLNKDEAVGLKQVLNTGLTGSRFVPLASGVWIAPGRILFEELVGCKNDPKVFSGLCVMHGSLAVPTQMRIIVQRLWDVDSIISHHRLFAANWGAAVPASPALPLLLRLFTAWTDLLFHDPGIPLADFGAAEVAAHSTQVFRELFDAVWPEAQFELDAAERQ